MPIPALLGALGSFAASPTGQSLIGAIAPSVVNYGMNWLRGGPLPEELAQQNYLQQIQQPINFGTAQRRQQLMNEFNQQIVPGLQEQFAGAGGTRSSAFGQQLGSAAGNLATNLGALGEQNAYQQAQLNQQRLGELGGYLGGQQRLGLEAQGLAQRGTIANMENALRAMGLMQNYDIGRQAEETRRMDVFGRLLGGYAQAAQAPRFDVKHHGPQAAGAWDLFGNLAKGIGTAAGTAAGIRNPFSFG